MTTIEIEERAIAGRRRQRLEYYEGKIQTAQAELVSLWKQLRDDPLQPYLANHCSLEAYLIDRWKMTPRRLQQIAAGEVLRIELAAEAPTELVPVVQRLNEGVIREIKTAPPERRMDVLREAVRTPGRVTAAKIKLAKARVIEPSAVIEQPKPETCPHCGQPMPL